MTADPELAEAIERARRVLGDRPRSELVRELAVRGIDALEQAEERRRTALTELAAMATDRWAGLDWEMLERIEELEVTEEGLPPTYDGD